MVVQNLKMAWSSSKCFPFLFSKCFPSVNQLSIGWPFQRFDEIQITSSSNDSFAFSYLLNPFLLATVSTNEISSFLYINQLGSISTSFWRYLLKSVRRKALGWISYFTPSSNSVPPNVFSWYILSNVNNASALITSRFSIGLFLLEHIKGSNVNSVASGAGPF